MKEQEWELARRPEPVGRLSYLRRRVIIDSGTVVIVEGALFVAEPSYAYAETYDCLTQTGTP